MLEFARHTPVERRILEMAGHIERERLTSEGSVTVVGVGLLRLLTANGLLQLSARRG